MPVLSWEKLAESVAYSGWRGILRRTFRLPDGREADYDIVRNGDYVVVAAFTAKGEAILIRQYRPGPEMVLTSFCEGYVDAQETPEAAARRELLEETGYAAGKLRFLKELRTAYGTERRLCFLATGCTRVGHPDGDENEFIEVFTMPPANFRNYLRDTADNSFTSVDAAYLALEAGIDGRGADN